MRVSVGTMLSTRATAAALAASLLLAGCLGGLGDPPATTTTEDDRQFAHVVRIENDLDAARNVTVTVSQAGAVVHEGRHTVDPGSEVVAYGWEDETVEGNRTFVVRMRPEGGEPRQVVFTVDDCHGNVVGYFGDDGFGATYSVC